MEIQLDPRKWTIEQQIAISSYAIGVGVGILATYMVLRGRLVPMNLDLVMTKRLGKELSTGNAMLIHMTDLPDKDLFIKLVDCGTTVADVMKPALEAAA